MTVPYEEIELCLSCGRDAVYDCMCDIDEEDCTP